MGKILEVSPRSFRWKEEEKTEEKEGLSLENLLMCYQEVCSKLWGLESDFREIMDEQEVKGWRVVVFIGEVGWFGV
jgi:hypothetical protein